MPSRNGRKFVARVADLDDDALHCHAYGHAWMPQDPEQVYDKRTDRLVWVERLECARCPKVRTDVMERYSLRKVGRSHYTEPDRFRVLEPIPRGRSAYLRESMHRALSRQRAAGRANRFQGV